MAQLPAWWDRVDGIMRAAGVPTRVWTAIAFPESSFVPWAANTNDPNGGSYGLFALNLGGQGHGYSVAYLKDAINNAQIAAPHLASAVQRCGADNIRCIALYSGHPVETGRLPAGAPTTLVDNIARYFTAAKDKTGQAIYDAFTSGQGIPATGDPGTGGGSTWSQFWEGFWGGAAAGILTPITGGGTPGGSSDPENEAAQSVLMFVAGAILVVAGVIIAAAKSPAGQAAANVAPAPVGMAARAL